MDPVETSALEIQPDRRPAAIWPFSHFIKNKTKKSSEARESRDMGDPFELYYMIALRKKWGHSSKAWGLCGPGKKCTKYVKDILVGLGCIEKSKRPGNVSAKTSDRELRKLNFTDAATLNPCAAKMGAVIVYDGPGNGHIEIKTPKGYLSDYISLEPRTAGISDAFIVSEAEFRIPGYAHPADTYCLQRTPKDRELRKVKAILYPPKGCIKI